MAPAGHLKRYLLAIEIFYGKVKWIAFNSPYDSYKQCQCFNHSLFKKKWVPTNIHGCEYCQLSTQISHSRRFRSKYSVSAFMHSRIVHGRRQTKLRGAVRCTVYIRWRVHEKAHKEYICGRTIFDFQNSLLIFGQRGPPPTFCIQRNLQIRPYNKLGAECSPPLKKLFSSPLGTAAPAIVSVVMTVKIFMHCAKQYTPSACNVLPFDDR